MQYYTQTKSGWFEYEIHKYILNSVLQIYIAVQYKKKAE